MDTRSRPEAATDHTAVDQLPCTPTGAPALHQVMDLMLDGVCVVDPAGRFLFVNAACERIFGYPPAEMLGRPMIEFVHPDDRERTLHAVDEIVAGGYKPHFENRYLHKSGRTVHIMWSARWSADKGVRVAVARDVTELKQAQTRQAALHAIAEAAHNALDLHTLLERIHPIVADLLPATHFFVALLDKDHDALSLAFDSQGHEALLTRHLPNQEPLPRLVLRQGKPVLLRRDAPTRWPGQAGIPHPMGEAFDWLGVPLTAQSGVLGVLGVKNPGTDGSYTPGHIEMLQFVSAQVAASIERKQMEARLQHMALHDTLTDLPNRSLFADRLRATLATAKRERHGVSLLFLDLDRFKQVNDSLGHNVGDLLLQAVAQRLKESVREADTVGRMGGDEFLVLLGRQDSPADGHLVAEKIRVALCAPYTLAGHAVSASPSIGLAYYPANGIDHVQLMRHADEAMYRAKGAGGNRVWPSPP